MGVHQLVQAPQAVSRLRAALRKPRTWAVIAGMAALMFAAILLLPEDFSIYGVIAIAAVGSMLIDYSE
jgi:hypothetical protein